MTLNSIPTFSVLGVRTHAINMDGAIQAFRHAIEHELKVYSHALGVAGVMEAVRNPYLCGVLNQSFLNTPDGMPLVWLGRHFGFAGIDRVYGPDLLREVCRYSADKGWRHFFYGAGPGVAPLLKQKMEERFPGIQVVGTYTPPFRDLTEEELTALCAQVEAARPDIFWISLSTPRQVYFMRQHLERINAHVLCAVGYAFDVNAGLKRDAPHWIRNSGFQWLHRLINEPRLWRRYFRDNPRFLADIFLQLTGLRKYPLPVAADAPARAPESYPVLAARIAATTISEVLRDVDGWIERREHHDVHFCTTDTVLQCVDDPKMAAVINTAGLSVPDGMPLVWLGRHRHLHVQRVYGPDLMLALCEHGQARGYRHFFYGGTPEVLEQLEQRLRARYPQLRMVGHYAPPFRDLTEEEEASVVAQINASRADIVWCGLGTPRQDFWVAQFRDRLNAAVLLAVGAAFNFHSGQVRQAPRWMMNTGLEWIFRLSMEPRRLWRRYLIGNPRFLYLLWKHRSDDRPRAGPAANAG
jgi:N-acetylglucosaminyldiphosphoundecaprenol N-acetyl-beta-D-mannosaminyltransferase